MRRYLLFSFAAIVVTVLSGCTSPSKIRTSNYDTIINAAYLQQAERESEKKKTSRYAASYQRSIERKAAQSQARELLERNLEVNCAGFKDSMVKNYYDCRIALLAADVDTQRNLFADCMTLDPYGTLSSHCKDEEGPAALRRLMREQTEAVQSFEMIERTRLEGLPKVRIGMSPSQVAENSNWGRPKSINSTITARGQTEQWVYGNGRYLYFTNGKLTAIQR